VLHISNNTNNAVSSDKTLVFNKLHDLIAALSYAENSSAQSLAKLHTNDATWPNGSAQQTNSPEAVSSLSPAALK
jgi:hypothetical protein